jgi:hypothetical protein
MVVLSAMTLGPVLLCTHCSTWGRRRQLIDGYVKTGKAIWRHDRAHACIDQARVHGRVAVCPVVCGAPSDQRPVVAHSRLSIRGAPWGRFLTGVCIKAECGAEDKWRGISMASNDFTVEPQRWEPPNAVRIHVVLDDIEPPIWRRLVVPLDTTLADLHHILQAAMGWSNSHLHAFEVGGLTYGDLDLLSADRSEDNARVYDASDVRLRDFAGHPGTAFTYVYDYGDDWRHTVTLEERMFIRPAPKTATCIDGARCCPPEDVGGSHSYIEFLRVLFTPEPDEIEDQHHLKRWSGGKFDPERFEVEKAAKSVRAALRKRRSG